MKRLVEDNGVSVILDLHGLSVREAERRLRRTLALAAARGRTSVRVIHGSSTSDASARNRTIKHMVEDLIAEAPVPEITGSYSTGEVTLVSLAITPMRDTRPITLTDVS